MFLLICRILYSIPVLIVAFFFLYKIWTKEVDIWGLFQKPTDMVLTKDKMFSVNYTWSSNTNEPVTWYVANETVTSIPCELLIHFTNLKSTPATILSYWVEQETVDGGWEAVTLPFGPNLGTFFVGANDLTNVKEVKFLTFDSVVSGKNIGAGETVTGTIFLIKLHVRRLKFSFSNIAGEIESAYLAGVPSGGGWPTQSIEMTSTGRTANLSKLPRVTKP